MSGFWTRPALNLGITTVEARSIRWGGRGLNALERLTLHALTLSGAMSEHEYQTEEHQEQKNDEKDEPIARHASFIPQRAQSLNPTGRQVAHQFGIGGGRPPKLSLNAPPERG